MSLISLGSWCIRRSCSRASRPDRIWLADLSRSPQSPSTRISNGSVGNITMINLSTRSQSMLLSISEDKITELLEASGERYAVFASDVPSVKIENYQSAYPTSYEASGTVYATPVLVTAETKEH